MRQMEQKVFSGAAVVEGTQVHVILAATSQRGAVAALHGVGLNVTVRQLAAHWRVTGNEKDCATALASPGEVLAASSLQAHDFRPLPKRPLVKPSTPPEPKMPKDPEGMRKYNKTRRETSDANKRQRGEVRLSSWLPPDAAAALNVLTGGDKSRGAVQKALVLALTTCAAGLGGRKAA